MELRCQRTESVLIRKRRVIRCVFGQLSQGPAHEQHLTFSPLAGASPPNSRFKYAFENGADLLAVGMFDFNVAKDVQAVCDVLKQVNRDRAWMA